MRALLCLFVISSGGCTLLFGDQIADRVCIPKTCADVGAECGQAPDGCDGILDCTDTCAAKGQFCGGGGANKCGTTPCSPRSCDDQGVTCGTVSDQCSSVLTCGPTCGSNPDLAGTFPLTVMIAGAGAGTVVSNPPGLSCSTGNCVGNFPAGTMVTLSGTPALSSSVAWSGPCTNDISGGATTCVVTVGAPTTVTATFELVYHTVMLHWKGSGTGTVTAQPSGMAYYGSGNVSVVNGSTLTLQATGSGAATVVGFTGEGCSGSGPCVIPNVTDDSKVVTVTLQDGTGALTPWLYNEVHPMSVATDASNNVVITGTFLGTVNFGGSDLTSVSSFGGDMFIAKFSSTGVHQWSKSFAGAEGHKVRTDGAGNVYVSGSLFSADFGCGTISNNSFLTKLTAAGACSWSKMLVNLDDFAVTPAGEALATGSTFGSDDLGGGPLPGDQFVVKYSSTGAHVWSKGLTATGGTIHMFLGADTSGNVVMGGDMTGTIDLGGGAISSSTSTLFWFLGSLAGSDGAYKWSGKIGDDGYMKYVTALAVGATGILLGGYGGGLDASTVDLGGGPVSIAADTRALLLAKYSLAGAYQWGKVLGDRAAVEGIALSSADDVYVTVNNNMEGTFFFGKAIDFGDGIGRGGGNFLTKLNSAGTAQWTRTTDVFLTGVAAASSTVYAVGNTDNEGGYLGTTQVAMMRYPVAEFSP